MALISISKTTDEKQYIPQTRDFLWYDTLLHKMNKFNCSRLDWEYKYDTESGSNRVMPKPVLIKTAKIVSVSQEKHLLQWLDRCGYDFDIVSDEIKNITVNITDEDYNDFVDDLERSGFKYEDSYD